jgi:AcrR family transcriptional regulator
MIDQPNSASPSDRPTVRAQRRERTRSAILTAAAQVFAARGYAGTSLREIAARAQVGQPLVLYHFESKRGVWQAAVDRLWRRLVDEVGESVRRAQDAHPREFVRAVLRSFIRVVAREPAWLQILLREAADPSARLEWLVEHHSQSTYDAGLDFLERAQSAGLLPALPTRHLLYVLVGALTFVIAIAPEVRRVTGADATSSQFLDDHVDTVMALLAGAAPGATAGRSVVGSQASQARHPQPREET